MTGKVFRTEETPEALLISLGKDVSTFISDDISLDAEEVANRVRSMNAPRVIIDFHEREYFGSALLEAILVIWHAVRDQKGKMALCRVSKVGRELLGLARFQTFLPICDSLEDAQHALEDSGS